MWPRINALLSAAAQGKVVNTSPADVMWVVQNLKGWHGTLRAGLALHVQAQIVPTIEVHFAEFSGNPTEDELRVLKLAAETFPDNEVLAKASVAVSTAFLAKEATGNFTDASELLKKLDTQVDWWSEEDRWPGGGGVYNDPTKFC